MSEHRRQSAYDYRLRDLVRKTGDLNIAAQLGVPRSTAAGWIRSDRRDVVTVEDVHESLLLRGSEATI